MKHLFSLFIVFWGLLAFGQSSKITISGTLTDAKTGEELIGATVFETKQLVGAGSNIYGFYSLTLNADSVELIFSYVGYQTERKKLLLSSSLRLNVALSPGTLLDEAIISSEQGEQIQEQTQMSTMDLDMLKVEQLPVLLGERDIMKTIQLLPGVQSGTEGASGLYVRGGGPDQNLILLDGVPVYNASHLFGFFSVFNSDAIRNVEIIKGGFPARYGGRTSSVIDIRMKEGNMKEFHGEGSIGIIASKLTLQGPIKKDKTSFLVSARRTYIDLLARPFISAAGNGERGGYYFYDVNAKLNHIINADNRLFLSSYFGKDRAYFGFDNSDVGDFQESNDAELAWGNQIVALRWNHIHNSRAFSNVTGTYSNYGFLVGNKFTSTSPLGTERTELRYESGIRDFGVKWDLDFIPSPSQYWKMGGGYTYHTFTPGMNVFEIENPEASLDTSFGSSTVYAHEIQAYIENDWKITEKLKINVGLHFGGFSVNDKFYTSLQPRLSGRYLLNEKTSIKASYARMTQFIHLLTNVSIGLPTDLWLPATDNVRPQGSDQIALGMATSLKNNFQFSAEIYYKWMTNLIEYKDGASFQGSGENWENLVEVGKGNAYGLELLLEKKSGKITGWVGYTLSWTNREFENLNFGEPFPYRFDRRHDIGLALSYHINDHIDMGFVWVYGTGNAVTLGTTTFSTLTNNPSVFGNNELFFAPPAEYFEERNDFRMPAYHRLDVGINLHKETKFGERTWSFGLYNMYNRQNPFFLYFGSNGAGEQGLFQISLFPVLPSFTYSFKF
ncbi:MAG: outer membrane receptor for ferrienterochelin and colicin [Flavobacteriales bacterium]|jgi:outer membrane receptor for ferrienterochelin and colicin